MERTKPVSLRVSDAALLEVGEAEGFVPFTYDDKDPKAPANKTFVTEANARMVDGRLTGPYGGTLTKGYGHTRTAKPGDRITREEALSLLRSDARDAESCVWRHVNVPLTQGEFDGVWDLFFNVGPGTLPSADYPQGKDGIACLGKSGGGRPSTLLTKLNEGDYTAAAECFSQWRMPRSIFEWGLLIRRIKFMLIFLGLPIVRAMNALPNAMPATDQGRYALVQECIRLAREELEDKQAMKPPLEAKIDGETVKGEPAAPVEPALPEPAPEPVIVAPVPSDTLVLEKPLPPSAAAPDTAGAAEAPTAPSPEAPPLAPSVQPDKPVIRPPLALPKSPVAIDVSNLQLNNIRVENGAKPMELSDRAIAFAIKATGVFVKIQARRGIIAMPVAETLFDIMGDAFIMGCVIAAGTWCIGRIAQAGGSLMRDHFLTTARTLTY